MLDDYTIARQRLRDKCDQYRNRRDVSDRIRELHDQVTIYQHAPEAIRQLMQGPMLAEARNLDALVAEAA